MDHKKLEHIIKGCIQFDREAQNALYEAYKTPMFKMCVRYADHIPEAEDMMQIGFTEVFQSINNYRGDGELGAWIRRVIFNNIMMYLRKKLRYPKEISLDVVMDFQNKDISALDKISGDELHATLSVMPLGYKTVFNLFVIEDYTHEEIAKELNISINTSKSQLRKARLYMQEKLAQYDYLPIKSTSNG